MWKTCLLPLVILLVIVLSGCNTTAPEEPAAEERYPVDVLTVTEGTVEQTVTISGTVMASEQAAVFPSLPGEVKKVHVNNGDLVEAGQLLVELASQDIELSVEQAQAGLQAAEAQLASAKAMREQGIRQAEQQLAQARRSYELAQSDQSENLSLDIDEENELTEALRPLLEMNTAQREMEIQQAEMAVKAAELALEQAKGTESVQAAEAAVHQAEIGVKMAEQQRQQLRIIAPISGQVTDLAVFVGQTVSPQMALMNVVDVSQPFIRATVSEAQLKWVQVGQEVDITVNAAGSRSVGQIRYISPIPGQQSRSYPLEVEWEEIPEGIVPGMIAQIELDLAEDKARLLVPIDAVLRQNDTYYVYVVEDGVAKQRAITPGEETAQWIVVQSGLEEGEQIVIQGQFSLYDGAQVNIRKERTIDEAD
ncbi:RND family efflux transporter MFP subunit [Caldalkalibacillus uzonensis]|uniref:RND family efflux transporter MFP subunit n=1 Tax=Caldalkalibacillus uzonensis TaxID=353224 RepID=A0ABU0CT67_9BACI|nr:efflux RND transporter periplasmic adaptor subunit [Caldalkalibacillus uzonensis]MDQ0339575.1 RND family efflux transporter MFP subunit [Caldalkalibacillus uzonensis]